MQVLTRVGFSGHHPLFLRLHNNNITRNDRPFRFESCWLTHPQFNEVVKENWNQQSPLHMALKDLSYSLSEWNKNSFGNIKKRKNNILARLGGIQRSNERNPFLEDLEKRLHRELDEVCTQEEYLWHQKSRAEWINSGDRNTKFYHLRTTNRRRKNRIFTLKNEAGTWLEDEGEIQNHVVNFYKDLFKEVSVNDLTDDTMLTFPAIDQRDDESLRRVISNEEIKQAIFAMGSLKAPGEDGFPALFYQGNWEIVGPNLCNFVKQAFHYPCQIKDVNKTLLVLIPKVPQPVSIKQFLPISLCNVNYKTIPKVIVGRLKTILPYIISPNQASFVPGRYIRDNIIIAQEIIHSMRIMKAKKGFMTIKVDLEKEYDRLS